MVEIAAFIIAITVVIGLPFGGKPIISALKESNERNWDKMLNPPNKEEYVRRDEFFTLQEETIELKKNNISLERISRYLGLGCVIGCLLDIIGILLLLTSGYISLYESAFRIAITLTAVLAIASIVFNSILILILWQSYRRTSR